MTDFINKYKPKVLNELIGNKKSIEKAKNWIERILETVTGKKRRKNALLVVGPPGIGKTTFAHILLKEYGYDPIEFNASIVRTARSVRENMSKIINNKNILTLLDSNRKSGIIMDEIDGCINGDKGGISQIIKMIHSKKVKRKITTPIICICNDEKKKKIGELKNHCEYIKFNYPSEYHMKTFIRKIIKLENIDISEYCVHLIYNHCQNDIRRVLYLLETVKLSIINDDNDKDKIDKIKIIFQNFDKKTLDLNLFTSTEKILTSKKLSPKEIINYVENDILLIPLIVHENMPIYLDKNCLGNNYEKLLELNKYYNYLIDYCVFERHIYKTQEWHLSDYICLLSCMSARNALSKFKKPKCRKVTNIRFTSLLSKNSQKYLNLKNLKFISRKLGISPDSFHYYSEIILQNILDEEKFDETIEYLRKKHVDKKDFDKFIKLSISSEIWEKRFTPKMKKEINSKLAL